MKIMGITGRKHVGKDTVADVLVEKFGYLKYPFATPLKEGVKNFFGFTDDQVYGDGKDIIDPRYGVTPRVFLIYFGKNIMQYDINKIIPVGKNFWVDRLMEQIDKLPEDSLVVISDLRFLQESEEIKRRGGMIWRIKRPGFEDTTTEDEEDIDYIKYDLLIENNFESVERFQQYIRTFDL